MFSDYQFVNTYFLQSNTYLEYLKISFFLNLTKVKDWEIKFFAKQHIFRVLKVLFIF